jgi:chloramphenicol-sensitive protein RarD
VPRAGTGPGGPVAPGGPGLLYGAGAYLLWGLFPLYWPLLEPARPPEILAHRIVWSLLVVVLLLALRRDWQWVRVLAGRPRAAAGLAAAAVLIAANWSVYIYGVNSGHVVETSLGYFINPVVTVLIGVVVLGERLRRAQWAAVALGAVAVLVLGLDYGRPPYLALALAFSFALYGLIKKQVGASVGAVQSLTVETAVLFVPALTWLLVLDARGDGQLGHAGWGQALLLASAGPVTAVPLLLFAAAARRVPLTALGLLQYLAPVLQFATGVLVYDEPMPASRLAGFALVWLALVVLTGDTVREYRRSRRARSPEADSAAALR